VRRKEVEDSRGRLTRSTRDGSIDPRWLDRAACAEPSSRSTTAPHPSPCGTSSARPTTMLTDLSNAQRATGVRWGSTARLTR
jgi:hypothetical protein